MKRSLLIALVLVLLCAAATAYFRHYWIHRYDEIIRRQATIYQLDPELVWSVIYEETYFRPWQNGEDAEVGLMQVTPTVGREWAATTGMSELTRDMQRDPQAALRDPERNIQVGCWYLEKNFKDFRDTPASEASALAAYNAGPSRAAEWGRATTQGTPPSEQEFVNRIDIPSTRAYVTNILARYRQLKSSGGLRATLTLRRAGLVPEPTISVAHESYQSEHRY